MLLRMKDDVTKRLLIVCVFLALVGVIGGGVWRYGYLQALDGLSRQAASDLALASGRFTGQLQRYRELAVLTADRPEVQRVLDGADTSEIEALLLETADKTSALDLVLIDAQGDVRASARGAIPDIELIGEITNRALQGALGWGHGQWGFAGPRVFLFAAPVFGAKGEIRAVLMSVADLGYVELDWVGSNPAVFFTDESGRVFFTNRSEITFWQRPVDGAGLKPANGETVPFSSYNLGRHEIWQMGWGPYLPKAALHLTLPLPVVGFLSEVLVDVAPARRLAMLQAAAVAALCLAFGTLLYVAMERRRTLATANTLLEARVTERTQELSQANAALQRAQADLVQAGKLSALGQMSAGISHELNQPLMAIQSFAQNGVQFLDGGKEARARENLGRVSDMAGRMSRIIKNLRAFARQESTAVGRVDVVAVVDSVVELLDPTLKAADVSLSFDRPAKALWVRGGEVRLGQVFANLISNAVDAMSACETRVLTLRIQEGDRILLTFEDTGPGIDVPDKVFEPFYSTKTSAGHDGMGLGLSISYGLVQSFGGDIRGRNTETGAIFTVELERWSDDMQEAAE